jgi:hypothetical protein
LKSFSSDSLASKAPEEAFTELLLKKEKPLLGFRKTIVVVRTQDRVQSVDPELGKTTSIVGN